MPAISKQAVLSAVDLPRERIELPEWGADAYVFVRGLTGTERDSWECYCLAQRKAAGSDNGFPGLRGSLLVRCLVDDDGNRIFDDGDVEALGGKSGKALDRLWEAAVRLSGIGKDDVEQLKKN